MTYKIHVRQNIILDDVELLFNELYNNTTSFGSKIDLYFTPYKSKRYFGLSAALIQFVASWLRNSSSGDFILNTRLLGDNELNEIYKKDEAFFPVISLVFKTKIIYNTDKSRVLNNLLKPFQNEYYRNMLRINNTQNDTLVLMNYDYVFYHPVFEINGKYIQSQLELSRSLVEPIISNVLKYSNTAKREFMKEQNSFFGIIFELMKNTFEWGRTDEKGVPFSPSIRGLLVKFFKKERVNFLEEYQSLPFISEYFNSSELTPNSKNQLYFMEISVFDTGSGLVKKYKSSNSVSDNLSDVDIIKMCLVKHNTSSSGIERSVKGIGLDRILRTTNKKGFIRIRTGKHCLYRNMIKDEYVESHLSNEIKLYDWNKASLSDFTLLKEASGTVISIIYPFTIPNWNE